MKKDLKLFLLFSTSALITGLAVACSEYFGLLSWIGLCPAIIAALTLCRERAKLSRFYFYGLLYFEIYFAVCFHWFVYLYPLDFTGLDNFSSVLVIIVAILGVPLLQALVAALGLWLLGVMAHFGVFEKRSFLSVLLIPQIYAVFEFLGTLGWWGVPWGRLCLSQFYFIPMISTASLLGSYAVSALIVFVNCAIAYAAKEGFSKRRSKIFAAAALCAIIANLAIGSAVYYTSEAKAEDAPKVTVAAIQGNFSSVESVKADPYKILTTYENYTRMAAEEGAQIILWPETSLSHHLDGSTSVGMRIKALAAETNATIIVGALSYTDNDIYNCLFMITPEGEFSETVYKKRHLVPFGEYVPMRKFFDIFLPFLSSIPMLSSDMTAADDPNLFYIEGIGTGGGLICFDSIYEALALDSVREGAEFFLLGTNDSWFSDSRAIYMHNDQARLRSIEFSRSTLRAANTGSSTIITPSGEITAMLEPLKRGYIVGDITISNDRTLYSYTGNLFILFCASSALITVCGAVIRKKRVV